MLRFLILLQKYMYSVVNSLKGKFLLVLYLASISMIKLNLLHYDLKLLMLGVINKILLRCFIEKILLNLLDITLVHWFQNSKIRMVIIWHLILCLTKMKMYTIWLCHLILTCYIIHKIVQQKMKIVEHLIKLVWKLLEL